MIFFKRTKELQFRAGYGYGALHLAKKGYAPWKCPKGSHTYFVKGFEAHLKTRAKARQATVRLELAKWALETKIAAIKEVVK